MHSKGTDRGAGLPPLSLKGTGEVTAEAVLPPEAKLLVSPFLIHPRKNLQGDLVTLLRLAFHFLPPLGKVDKE